MASWDLLETDVLGTIGPKQRHPIRFLRRYRRKLALLIFAILLYILLWHLPSAPQFENDARANRPPPVYDVDTAPRFLYHSPFRQSPNYKFESELSDALRQIEEIALSLDGESNVAKLRIWQVGLGMKERSDDSRFFEHENSDWEFHVVTDDWAAAFIRETLAAIPQLWEFYASYPYDVLRADLLRYLLLWYYGGYYADMDVFPARPIKSCPALQQRFSNDANISLVLGIEIDEPYASPRLMREWHWSRSYGFIQYTMLAPRRFSPMLREAIIRVISHTKQHREQTSMFHSPKYDETAILEITGPGVFTDAILDYLSATLPPTHALITASLSADAAIGDLVTPFGHTQPRVTWAPFHRITEPMCIDNPGSSDERLVDGLCVLPINVWGNGQRHSGAEGFDSTQACINHRFGRSWKKGWWEYIFG